MRGRPARRGTPEGGSMSRQSVCLRAIGDGREVVDGWISLWRFTSVETLRILDKTARCNFLAPCTFLLQCFSPATTKWVFASIHWGSDARITLLFHYSSRTIPLHQDLRTSKISFGVRQVDQAASIPAPTWQQQVAFCESCDPGHSCSQLPHPALVSTILDWGILEGHTQLFPLVSIYGLHVQGD